jgi:hypothetical protein
VKHAPPQNTWPAVQLGVHVLLTHVSTPFGSVGGAQHELPQMIAPGLRL